MKRLSHITNTSNILPNVQWFNSGNSLEPPFYVQDTMHLLTKLKSRFLKSKGYPKLFPFGRYYIAAEHLQCLIDDKNIDRSQHRLTKTTMNPIDKQNYISAKRLCHQRVIDLLEKNINGSQGTVKFLEIMQNVNDAFEGKNLPPYQRLEKIWYSLFIVRLWRQYILPKKYSTLKDNFLTTNC